MRTVSSSAHVKFWIEVRSPSLPPETEGAKWSRNRLGPHCEGICTATKQEAIDIIERMQSLGGIWADSEFRVIEHRVETTETEVVFVFHSLAHGRPDWASLCPGDRITWRKDNTCERVRSGTVSSHRPGGVYAWLDDPNHGPEPKGGSSEVNYEDIMSCE